MISKDLKPIGVKLPTLPVDERNRRNIFMIDLFPPASGPPPPVYDPAYQAILDYATLQGYVAPSLPVKDLQNQLVIALKNAGVWTDLDLFYNFFGDGDVNFAKINWKNPGTFQAVGTGHEPTYTINGGFKGDGVATYLDTQWKTNLVGNKFVESSDASYFVDTDTVELSASKFVCGYVNSVSPFSATYLSRNSTNGLLARLGGAGESNSAGFTGQDVIQIQRRNGAAGGTHYFGNGVELPLPLNGAYSAPVVSEFYLLAAGITGVATGFTNVQLKMFGAGASLSGKELSLYTAWSTYKAAILAPVAYKAITDYATLQGYALPSVANQTKQQKLIYDLMSAGVWDSLDVFYNFLTDGSANFSKINWKAPGTFQATFSAFITFTSMLGATQTNGADPNAVSSGFSPSVNVSPSTNFQLNSASFGFAVTGAIPASNVAGSGGGVPRVYVGLFGGGNWSINDSSNSTLAQVFDGFHIGSRSAVNALRVSKNGNVLANYGTVSTGLPVGVLGWVKQLDSGSPVGTTCQLGFIGGSNVNGKELAFYNAWQAYKIPAVADYAYQRVLDYATLQGYALPSIAVQTIQLELIYNLVRDGVWNELDLFYNFLGDGDADFARINWINPGVNQLDNALSTFTPNSGFMFNLPTATNYLPDGLGQYTQDYASLIVDATTSGAAITTFTSSLIDNLEISFMPSITFHSQWALNDQTLKDTDLGAFTNGRYLLHFQRANVDYSALWRNGAMVNSYNDLSTGLPMIGLIYSPSDTVHRMLAAGGALVGKELAFNTDWQNYVGWFPG